MRGPWCRLRLVYSAVGPVLIFNFHGKTQASNLYFKGCNLLFVVELRMVTSLTGSSATEVPRHFTNPHRAAVSMLRAKPRKQTMPIILVPKAALMINGSSS